VEKRIRGGGSGKEDETKNKETGWSGEVLGRRGEATKSNRKCKEKFGATAGKKDYIVGSRLFDATGANCVRKSITRKKKNRKGLRVAKKTWALYGIRGCTLNLRCPARTSK